MGIRPSFYIVVGIDDAKPDDPRHVRQLSDEEFQEIVYERDLTEAECYKSKDGWWDDYHQGQLYKQANVRLPEQMMNLGDKLYNPGLSDEYSVGNVIGYLIFRTHDDPIFRAFAAIDPDTYLSTKRSIRIPLLDEVKHPIRAREYTLEDIRCNRFVPGVFESMASLSRVRWKQAQHYLRLVGWEIPEEDLRYLLVWDWG